MTVRRKVGLCVAGAVLLPPVPIVLYVQLGFATVLRPWDGLILIVGWAVGAGCLWTLPIRRGLRVLIVLVYVPFTWFWLWVYAMMSLPEHLREFP